MGFIIQWHVTGDPYHEWVNWITVSQKTSRFRFCENTVSQKRFRVSSCVRLAEAKLFQILPHSISPNFLSSNDKSLFITVSQRTSESILYLVVIYTLLKLYLPYYRRTCTQTLRRHCPRSQPKTGSAVWTRRLCSLVWRQVCVVKLSFLCILW